MTVDGIIDELELSVAVEGLEFCDLEKNPPFRKSMALIGNSLYVYFFGQFWCVGDKLLVSGRRSRGVSS